MTPVALLITLKFLTIDHNTSIENQNFSLLSNRICHNPHMPSNLLCSNYLDLPLDEDDYGTTQDHVDMNGKQQHNTHLGGEPDDEDPLRKPLGPPSPTDTPRTSCIKENLYRVTSIPIDYCLSQMEHSTAGSNNRSGFRGVRQVS
jgi:hypothetical protein